jgi:hypothetical protein
MAGILMMTAGVAPSPAQGVRAWLDTVPIPTYYEAPPETTPTFEALFGEGAVYPYTARPNFTNRRSIEKWRIIHLENSFSFHGSIWINSAQSSSGPVRPG